MSDGGAKPVATQQPAKTTERRGLLVAILFVVMVVNFADRQILPILLESIKRDLRASDTEMGLLSGFAFVLFFALAGLPLARLADVSSRRHIIAVALGFWSVMTMLSGRATTFLQLAAFRMGLGIGEAASGPAAQSIISDLYPSERRTGALSLLAVAGPIGVMVAFVVGGALEQAAGWRYTFVVVGTPGFLLALVQLLASEPRRGAAEQPGVDVARYDLRETATYLLSLHSLRYITAGASLNLFCG